jgi:hypothetical protein
MMTAFLPITPPRVTSSGTASSSGGTAMFWLWISIHGRSAPGSSSVGKAGAFGGSPRTPGSGQGSTAPRGPLLA